MNEEVVNALDASLGLIYRLNILWRNVDVHSTKGEYDDWNNELDAIFRNLLFEKDMLVGRDKDGNVISINFNEEDHLVYRYLSKRIFIWKNRYNQARQDKKNKLNVPLIRSKWYESLMLKDIWLRKLMQREKLYLNRKKAAPGTALFGSFSNKKR